MAIGADVRTYLLTKSAVTTVVGTRIYPGFVPQKISTYPLVVYSVVSSIAKDLLTGGAGWAETRIQLDVYATTAVARDSLVEILRDELQGFPTTSSKTMGSSTVTAVVYLNSLDLYEPPQDNSDTGLFRNSTDYWFRHSQAVPTYAA